MPTKYKMQDDEDWESGDTIKLDFQPNDVILPCSHCGSKNLSMVNTHSASYWIECPCGAEMHGKSYTSFYFDGSWDYDEKLALKYHVLAKNSAIRKWNKRA